MIPQNFGSDLGPNSQAETVKNELVENTQLTLKIGPDQLKNMYDQSYQALGNEPLPQPVYAKVKRYKI